MGISQGEKQQKCWGMSISTAYRYFDRGILTGEQHPITRFRRIDKANVLALMGKHGMKWEEEA